MALQISGSVWSVWKAVFFLRPGFCCQKAIYLLFFLWEFSKGKTLVLKKLVNIVRATCFDKLFVFCFHSGIGLVMDNGIDVNLFSFFLRNHDQTLFPLLVCFFSLILCSLAHIDNNYFSWAFSRALKPYRKILNWRRVHK